jgi:hypothetical protein
MHAPSDRFDRRSLLAGLMLATLAPAARAADHRAKAAIAEMYRIFGSEGNVSIFFDDAMRRKFLSRRLRAALTAMEKRTPKGDAPDLDFDPVSNSNDPSIHDLKIKTDSETPTRAAVIADFQSHQDTQRVVLRYELVRENGWKIDNIVASGKNSWDLNRIVSGKR